MLKKANYSLAEKYLCEHIFPIWFINWVLNINTFFAGCLRLRKVSGIQLQRHIDMRAAREGCLLMAVLLLLTLFS